MTGKPTKNGDPPDDEAVSQKSFFIFVVCCTDKMQCDFKLYPRYLF